LVNIPLRSFTCKRALEQPKMNGIIADGIGGTPHVERSVLVGGSFASKAFELGNVGGKPCWHSRPTNIVANRIINQLIEIGETEADHIREQRGSRGRSRSGSTGSGPSSRTGVRARSRTRHGGGRGGRTRMMGRKNTWCF